MSVLKPQKNKFFSKFLKSSNSPKENTHIVRDYSDVHFTSAASISEHNSNEMKLPNGDENGENGENGVGDASAGSTDSVIGAHIADSGESGTDTNETNTNVNAKESESKITDTAIASDGKATAKGSTQTEDKKVGGEYS